MDSEDIAWFNAFLSAAEEESDEARIMREAINEDPALLRNMVTATEAALAAQAVVEGGDYDETNKVMDNPLFDNGETYASGNIVEHNKVMVTDPKIVKDFMNKPDSYSESDVEGFRSVMFDEKQSSHAAARMGCHTMKMLYLIHKTYDLPLKDLTYLCGSDESHRCQGVADNGSRCGKKAVAGLFFCGMHRNDNSHAMGAEILMKRRRGMDVDGMAVNKKKR